MHRFAFALLVTMLPVAVVAKNQTGPEPAVAYIVIEPVQERLLGPTEFRSERSSFRRSWIGQSSALTSLVGGFAALVRRHDSRPWLNKLSEFDFANELIRRLPSLASESSWTIAGSEQFSFVQEMRRSLSGRVFKYKDANLAVLMNPAYFISPGLDQVRLVIEVEIYVPPSGDKQVRPQLLLKRTYEYLSPSRGTVLRPFHKGEKAEMRASLDAEFRRLIDKNPKSAGAYRKDRKRALKFLDSLEHVPVLVAMREGWPDDTLSQALVTATDSLLAAIAEDWSALPALISHVEVLKKFSALDAAGRSREMKGTLLSRGPDSSVFQTREGSIYVVP